MSQATDAPRLYRLTRPDGLGFFRRRSGRQFALGAAGVLPVTLALKLDRAPVALRLGLVLGGAVLVVLGATKTPSGENLLDVAVPFLSFLRRRCRRELRWAAPLSPLGGALGEVELPPGLGGLALLDIDPRRDLERVGARIGVVRDHADGTLAAAIRVSGQGFLVAGFDEQELRLAGWGQALAQFCREGHPVVRVTCSQWLAPAGLSEHRIWLDGARTDAPNEEIAANYEEVLALAGHAALKSEVLVTLSISLRKAKVLPHHDGDRLLAGIERLFDELELFSAQLQRSGHVVSRPLSSSSLAQALRTRLDPGALVRLEARGRTLGELSGAVDPRNAFPIALEEEPTRVFVDGAVHRVFRVAEWPRTAVRADFLAGFCCGAGIVRAFTVIFTPQSRRAAKREASVLATKASAAIDEKQSHRRRVGAEERRIQDAAEAIDEELESGAGMELFVGLVDVAASSVDELEGACEEATQLAANCGMELRQLTFRQLEGLVAALPLGRTVLAAR